MSRSQNCTGTVRRITVTAARLGPASAQQPPAWMRDRVMAAVARTRQVPAGDDAARHARPAARLRPLTRLAMVGGALAVVAAVVLAITLVNTQHQLNQANRQLSQAQAPLH